MQIITYCALQALINLVAVYALCWAFIAHCSPDIVALDALAAVVYTLTYTAISRTWNTCVSVRVPIVSIIALLTLLAISTYCTIRYTRVTEIITQIITNITQCTDISTHSITANTVSKTTFSTVAL